jgi:hypothetical protein
VNEFLFFVLVVVLDSVSLLAPDAVLVVVFVVVFAVVSVSVAEVV